MKKRKVEGSLNNILEHKPVILKIFSFINSTQDYFSFSTVCKQTFLVSRLPAIEERFRGYFQDLQKVQIYSWNLKYVKKQTPEICMAAVQKNGTAIQYVKDQTPEICMAAVQQHGYALQYIKDQTPEICMAVVQQNSWALRLVKDQTPEICIAAVQQNSYALKYVKEQTPEICMAAVQQNSYALTFVAPKFRYLFLKIKNNG